MKYLLLLIILSSPVYSEDLWQNVVLTYPENYIDGEGKSYESVYYEGVLEEKSTYNLLVEDGKRLRLLSGSVNGESIKESEIGEIEDRINFQFIQHNFDPFEPDIQNFIKYQKVTEKNGLVEFSFTYNNGEDNIVGSVYIAKEGLPHSCDFTLTSLPIEGEDLILRELKVEYYYKEAKTTPWVLYSVVEKSVLDIFYTLFRIPLNVETSYIFYRL